MCRRLFRIAYKLSEWLLAILIVYAIILPYIWSKIFVINYASKEIYIPGTGERLYFITYNPRLDPTNEVLELSSCNWRIYTSDKYKYRVEGTKDGIRPFYYKISNDTLYITTYYKLKKPQKWRMKTKIILNTKVLIDADGKVWPSTSSFNFSSEAECKKWEERGYVRFP